LLLSFCLLPYLLSSIYSLVTALLQVPGGADWLWGDWLSTVVPPDGTLYMLLAEGPVCCVGALGLLIVILGTVLMIGGSGEAPAEEVEEGFLTEGYEYDEYDPEGYLAGEYGADWYTAEEYEAEAYDADELYDPDAPYREGRR
jgi:hypothetical protein